MTRLSKGPTAFLAIVSVIGATKLQFYRLIRWACKKKGAGVEECFITTYIQSAIRKLTYNKQF